MDWVCLGHAMWLVRVGGLRLLFDPLLDGVHHGGVLQINPARTIDAAALRADFIFVSHRHPDHFDVPSLARLAQLDADSVVVTPDSLVADTCRKLGFRSVRMLAPWQRVELDGTTLLSTPSDAEDIEWGMMVATEDGVAWNQVDSQHASAAAIADTLRRAAEGLARPALRERVALGLVHWQPLLEVQAMLGEATQFPFGAYGNTLDQIAMLNAHTLVLSSAGACHRGAAAWLNKFVYPVTDARALEDISRRCPNSSVTPAIIGQCQRVVAGAVHSHADQESLVSDIRVAESYSFQPFAGPDVADPNIDNRPQAQLRGEVDHWLRDSLVPALGASYPKLHTRRAVTLQLEVVYPNTRDNHCFRVDSHGCNHTLTHVDDYDVLNVIAGSQLADVIAGRRHWGEPLLGGFLRASQRAYEVTPNGLQQVPIGSIFLYYALSYAESNRRWVAYQVERCITTADDRS